MITGQIDIFDLLEPEKPKRTNSQRDRSPISFADQHFVPSPDNPVYCVMCGREQTSYFDYQNNHSPLGWLAGNRMCTAMNLTLNHVQYAVGQVVKSVSGETPAQCCWDTRGIHGKSVRKPTTLQLADHLRWQINYTRDRWGIRSDVFDEWLGAYLIDRGVLKYSLDPVEYPWEFEEAHASRPEKKVKLPFTATTGPNKYDDEFCAYCGTRKNLNEMGCGPSCDGYPDYSYNICNPCSEKYRTMRPPIEQWTFKEIP